jgi:hypothetical protein
MTDGLGCPDHSRFSPEESSGWMAVAEDGSISGIYKSIEEIRTSAISDKQVCAQRSNLHRQKANC